MNFLGIDNYIFLNHFSFPEFPSFSIKEKNSKKKYSSELMNHSIYQFNISQILQWIEYIESQSSKNISKKIFHLEWKDKEEQKIIFKEKGKGILVEYLGNTGFNFIKKICDQCSDIPSFHNEYFISVYGLNFLRDIIPTFNFTYSCHKKDNIFTIKQEYTEGILLRDFIQQCSNEDFLSILFQIPEGEGYGNPAAPDGADAGGGGPLWSALLPGLPARWPVECLPDRAGLRASFCPELFQHAQDVDLWRVERDSAQHHHQDDSRALGPGRTGRAPGRARLSQHKDKPQFGGQRRKLMDFNFTEEQTMIRDSLSRLIREKYDFDTRRSVVEGESGWRPDFWAQLAELGLLMAPFSEDDGGLGGGAIDAMVVMEEFGKGLVVEPYIPTVVCAGGFLKHGGSAAQKEEHLAGIMGGESVWAFAYAEPRGRYNLADLETTAKADGSGYILNGHKAVVIGAPWASKLIVSARTSGDRRDRGGISLFIVDKDAAGVTTRDYPTVDGRRASEVYFENVSLGADALIGDADGALPLIEQVVDEATAAVCAEAVGHMGYFPNYFDFDPR